MQFIQVSANFVSFGEKETFTTKENKKVTNSFAFFSFIHDYGPDFDQKEKTVRFKLSDKVVDALKSEKIKLEKGKEYNISGGFETRSSEKDGKKAHFTEAYISRVQPEKGATKPKETEGTDNDLPF